MARCARVPCAAARPPQTSFVHFKADMLEEKRRRRQSDDAMAKGAAILFAGRR